MSEPQPAAVDRDRRALEDVEGVVPPHDEGRVPSPGCARRGLAVPKGERILWDPNAAILNRARIVGPCQRSSPACVARSALDQPLVDVGTEAREEEAGVRRLLRHPEVSHRWVPRCERALVERRDVGTHSNPPHETVELPACMLLVDPLERAIPPFGWRGHGCHNTRRGWQHRHPLRRKE